MDKRLLSVEDLSLEIPLADKTLHAIRGVDLHVGAGETLGIVGESGSGKSLTVLSILGLHPAGSQRSATQIELDGVDLLAASDRQMSRQVRGVKTGMIFQEPMTSLNPVLTIGQQMMEVLATHRQAGVAEARERAISLLERVGIAGAESRLKQYPHQFSGGQRQRIMIAMALMSRPKLLVADEPTTALDVTVQAEILRLLKELQAEMGMALILVSHNLSIISQVADRIAVMYAGRIAETGAARELLAQPHHPYTRALLGALPERARPGQRLRAIPGIVPSLTSKIPGCAFAPRCSSALPKCNETAPPAYVPAPGHASYCWLDGQRRPESDAIEIEQPIQPPGEAFLVAQGTERTFTIKRGLLGRPQTLRAVRGLDLTVRRGEFFALVGESGCGKSTLARVLLELDRADVGVVQLGDQVMAAATPRERARLIQPVFQDPRASLNPRRTVFQIVRRPLEVHGLMSEQERDREVTEILAAVGLAPRTHHMRPSSLSGGQRQRVAIARALILRPSMLLCDEPTSALDVSVQAQIINLLSDLRRTRGLSILLITHDLGVVRHMADRMAVMYLGQIVEEGDAQQIFRQPAHPYTQALIRSSLPVQGHDGVPQSGLKPGFPNPLSIAPGCSFNPRCPHAIDECRTQLPELRDWHDRRVRCHLTEQLDLRLTSNGEMSNGTQVA